MAQIATELVDLTIKYISLVPAGANRRKFVAKGDGSFEIEARIVEKNDDLMECTGVIYPVGEVDTQGEFVSKETLRLAMHDFMAKGRPARGIAGDINHNEQATGDFFSEIWEIKAGDARFPNPEDVGAWACTRKIEDEETWALIKSGELNAFSFGGFAVPVPNQEVRKMQKADKSKLVNLAVVASKGRISDTMNQMAVYNMVEATASAIWEAYYNSPADTDEEKAAVREVVEEAMTLFKTDTNGENPMEHESKGLLAWARGLISKSEDGSQIDAAEAIGNALKAQKADLEAAHTGAVETLKAEHTTELEALKTAHAEELVAKDAEIEALKALAPESKREDAQANKSNTGGGFLIGRIPVAS